METLWADVQYIVNREPKVATQRTKRCAYQKVIQ